MVYATLHLAAARAVAISPSGCITPCTPIGARIKGDLWVTPNNVVYPQKNTSRHLILFIFTLRKAWRWYTHPKIPHPRISRHPRHQHPLGQLSYIGIVRRALSCAPVHIQKRVYTQASSVTSNVPVEKSFQLTWMIFQLLACLFLELVEQ